MTTLIVYYSKTGNSEAVALRLSERLGAAVEKIVYDSSTHSIGESAVSPADFERIIVVCPIWAFGLPDPMSLYLARYKDGIKRYSLIVTCMLGGLSRCVAGSVKILGREPERTLKIKGKVVASGEYSLDGFEG